MDKGKKEGEESRENGEKVGGKEKNVREKNSMRPDSNPA